MPFNPSNDQELKKTNELLAMLQPITDQEKIDIQRVLGIGEYKKGIAAHKDAIIFYDDPAYPRVRATLKSFVNSPAHDKNKIAEALLGLAVRSERTVRWDFFATAENFAQNDHLKWQLYSQYHPEVNKIKPLEMTLDRGFYYLQAGFSHNENKAKNIFKAIELGQGNPQEQQIAKLVSFIIGNSGKEIKTAAAFQKYLNEIIDLLLTAQDILPEKTQLQLISLLNQSKDTKRIIVQQIIKSGRARQVLENSNNLLTNWLRTPEQFLNVNLGFCEFNIFPSRNNDKKIKLTDTPEFKTLRDSVRSVSEQKSPARNESIVQPPAPTQTPTFSTPAGWEKENLSSSASETIVTKSGDEKQQFVVNHENGKISTKQNSFEVFKAMMETYKNTHPEKIPTMSAGGNNPDTYLNMLKAFQECYPDTSLQEAMSAGKMKGNQNQWKQAIADLSEAKPAFRSRRYS